MIQSHKGRPYGAIFSHLRWPGLRYYAPLGLQVSSYTRVTPGVQPKISDMLSPRGEGSAQRLGVR
jgi:hypothetical protein